MRALSARERKLVALLLLVGALFMAWSLVIGPLIGGFGDRATARAALTDRYERDARSVAQMAALRRAAAGQRSSAGRFVEVSANPADALRDRVAVAVAASGGTLKAVEDVAAAPARVRVRADSQLSILQLNALLAGLARGTPLLVIDSMSVAADEAFQTNRSGQMDVRLEVSARIAAPRSR